MPHDVIRQPGVWEGQRTRPRTDHHTAVRSSPRSVLKYCQTLLALRPVLRLISISSSVHRAFYLPFPCRHLTFTQSFTGFTHLFTRRSNFFFLSHYLLIKHSAVYFCNFWTFSDDWVDNLQTVHLWDELGCAPDCLFNCGSNRLRDMERMRPVIYPDGLLVEVWGWPAHCGNTTLAFLGIADRFQDHCVFFPPSSLRLCLLWMACLIIYRKGKGSSWSNKHVTALYFVFHWEGRVL